MVISTRSSRKVSKVVETSVPIINLEIDSKTAYALLCVSKLIGGYHDGLRGCFDDISDELKSKFPKLKLEVDGFNLVNSNVFDSNTSNSIYFSDTVPDIDFDSLID